MDDTQFRPATGSGGIAWFAVLLGVALGIAAALIYTWKIDPVIERNTAPWQLGPQAREEYVVAVALSYAHNGNLQLAFDRLRALRPNQNVWAMVAEVACERHRTVQVQTNSDVIVMRALEQLYRPQGASGCADGQYPTPAPVNLIPSTPTPLPTATLTPPATKTATPPLPTPAALATTGPTRTPQPEGSRIAGRPEPFCDSERSGMIEVQVSSLAGLGIPGVPVQVTWGGDQRSTFYTGLKPGRDPGFADFQMEAGRTYTVTVPDLVSPPAPVEAVPCDEVIVGGETVPVLTSYRIRFQEQAN